MTVEQVKKSESAEYIGKIENIMVYEGTVSDLPAVIYYDFDGNKLWSGMYIIDSDYVNNNLYIRDYDKLKKGLIAKYGNPIHENDEIWFDDLFQDEPRSNWGTAIAAEQLSLMTVWDVDGTKISLTLTGSDFEVMLGINYSSPEKEQASEEIDLDDL